MGLEKRTVKIIIIVVVTLLLVGAIVGLVLGLVLPYRYVVLEVWPRSEEYNWEEPLIEFKAHDLGSWQIWVRRITEFLRVYETTVPEQPSRAPCSIHRKQDYPRTPNCDIAMSKWHPCTIDVDYGYPLGKPCVFLRLNHIHYWVPEPYNTSVSFQVPNDMPQFLRHAMEHHPAYRFGDYAWVSCDGEYSSDKENIGPVNYIAGGGPPGFPLSRLHTADRIPWAARSLPERDPGPLVAVHFENPRRGVLINVECRIWTRDLDYDRSRRYGHARFELFVE